MKDIAAIKLLFESCQRFIGINIMPKIRLRGYVERGGGRGLIIGPSRIGYRCHFDGFQHSPDTRRTSNISKRSDLVVKTDPARRGKWLTDRIGIDNGCGKQIEIE